MPLVARGHEPAQVQKVAPSSTDAMRSCVMTWMWGERKTRWLCAVLFSLAAAYMVLAAMFVAQQARHGGQTYCGDFFALWTYGRIASDHPVKMLYDSGVLHAAQVRLGMPPARQWPFPYPPFVLAVLMPLSMLPVRLALFVWETTTIGIYLIATCGGNRHPLAWIALLVAPTTTIGMLSGQSGFLAASLMIGGLKLLSRWPALAGVLFGLLSYKLQLSFLLPVALLAAREWRALASAGTIVVALVVSSSLAFGPAIWLTFLHSLPAYERWFDSVSHGSRSCPTVMAALQSLGAPTNVARLAQSVALIGSVLLAWKIFRDGIQTSLLPVIPALTVLGTPHAFDYDLPMLASAVVIFLSERLRYYKALQSSEVFIVVLVAFFPAIMTWRYIIAPIGPPVLAGFVFLTLFVSRRYMCGPRAARNVSHQSNA